MTQMRKGILVKPNLKLILLGALLIAALHDVFTRGMSESAIMEHPYRVSWMSDQELSRLIDQIDAEPNSAGYILIAQAYEKRGDTRRALYFMRKAEAISPLLDLAD